MRLFDWAVLVVAMVAIVVYGIWKGRGSRDIKGYLLSDRNMPWYAVALSIMATQASAITFLSTPGQAYDDGMRFVQIYLGLPIAMVILSITAIPLYHRLQVYTAYEYLESRFDLKTRSLGAFLFLTQRGLAAGLTIFAPSLIVSTILGWSLGYTNLVVGVLVIIYTTIGGTKAVNWTQFQQMLVITVGMFTAFGMVLFLLPDGVGFSDAAVIAGRMGRLNAIDWSFDLKERYNIWSGVIGGLFLSLSYFGTDQSQVQRYLTARSVHQSRLGLLFNAMVKIPMQFFILLLGAMVFVFYQFATPPIFFNSVQLERAREGTAGSEIVQLEERYEGAAERKREHLEAFVAERGSETAERQWAAVEGARQEMSQIRDQALDVMESTDEGATRSDTNFIFLSFVVAYLPVGLVGLLIASILFASMSSTASELNALASTTLVDIYRRMVRPEASDAHYLLMSKVFTVMWGFWAILFAQFANRLGTLVEAVNILGSLFYGTILGIFLLAFYSKRISSTATFLAAIIGEVVVLACFLFTEISYLWFNVVGCVAVVIIAELLQLFLPPHVPRRDAVA